MVSDNFTRPEISVLQTEPRRTSCVGSVLSPSEARMLLEKYNVSEEIRRHGEAVGNAAKCLATALEHTNCRCDPAAVQAAGIIHDICKGMRNHDKEAGVLLRKLGFGRTAELVEDHQIMHVNNEAPFGEAELVFLADKLIQGTTIVPVRSRYDHKIHLYADNPEATAVIIARREDALSALRRFEALSGKNAAAVLRSGKQTPNNTPGIAVLIPSAGFSSRMGQFKPLLPFADTTVLGHITELWHSCGVYTILAVSGHRAAELETEARRLQIRTVRNLCPEDGMFSSVRLGLADLCAQSKAEWIAVHPADIPLVSPLSLNALIETASARRSGIICPIHTGQKGHPPLLHRSVAKQVLMWSGEDGLRGALRDVPTTYVDVADAGILHDMDFPDDYREAILRHTNRQPSAYHASADTIKNSNRSTPR